MITRSALRQRLILQIPAALVTLGLMWLLPFLVHLLPLNGPVPAGARLLPIFYAPLLAVWLFHPVVAVFSSLLMPFLNHALTGMPALNMAAMLSVELSVFSLVLVLLRRRFPRQPLLAPLAVVAGKVTSAALLFLFPLMPLAPWAYLTSSLFNALPGLLILLALNLALIRLPDER